MKRNLSSLIFTGLLIIGCGEDGSSGGDAEQTEAEKGRVDTTNLENTVDEDGLQVKGEEAQSVYDDLDKKIAAVNGQTTLTGNQSEYMRRGMRVMSLVNDMAGKYGLGTETSNPEEDSAPSFELEDGDEDEMASTFEADSEDMGEGYKFDGEFEDCDSGFKEIAKFYEEGKDSLENELATLKDPSNPKGEFSQWASGMELEKIEKEGKAIAYNFKAKDSGSDWFKMSGSMSAAASETIIAIESEFEMEIDFSAAQSGGQGSSTDDQIIVDPSTGQPIDTGSTTGPTQDPLGLDSGSSDDQKIEMKMKSSIEADLTAKAIDFVMDADYKMSGQDMKAKIHSSVVGGDDPSIDWTVESTFDEKTFSANMKLTLVDENTILLKGNSSDGSESADYEITMKKGSDGLCTVEM